jgi:hypothetical protein
MGITLGEEGLNEVVSVGIEVIRVAGDSPHLDDQRKADETLGR